MSNNINIYNSGIQGYTVKGDVGDSGDKGHNIFFSVYTDTSVLLYRIKNELSLSNRNETGIKYNVNDTIICSDAKMYTILKHDDNDTNIEYVGDIINQTTYNETYKDFNDIVMNNDIVVVDASVKNDDKIDTSVSLYPRYLELTSDVVNGYYVYIPKFIKTENVRYKLVINHICGLLQEIDITIDNVNNDDENYQTHCNRIFIENKYFYLIPLGMHHNLPDLASGIGYENIKDYIKKRSYIDVYNTTTDYVYRFKLEEILQNYNE